MGQMVRNPSQMSIDDMVYESRGLSGGQRFAPRAAGTIASGGTFGLGTLASLAGEYGIDQRQRQLAPEIEHKLAGILATGARTPASMRPRDGTGRATVARTPPTQQQAFVDAYERGRQAAGGGQPRDQRDIGRSQQASPGMSRSDDRDVGWGGA